MATALKWNNKKLIATMTRVVDNIEGYLKEHDFPLCHRSRDYFTEAFYALGRKPPQTLRPSDVRVPTRSIATLRLLALRMAAWFQMEEDPEDATGETTDDGHIRRMLTGGSIAVEDIRAIMTELKDAGVRSVPLPINLSFLGHDIEMDFGLFDADEDLPDSKDVTVFIVDASTTDTLYEGSYQIQPDWSDYDAEVPERLNASLVADDAEE